ncbi:NifB/NifX family molybdenum-iron cluster-binding protein [Infirmifilum lucidum]|uniref:NifB/NifX family molybdenum-iron cluster-binding protein n=1 Tax=Infirmifilum lucidum TaxID=2776706 RepID=A0A7L9FGL1_9CREN|nr:NifB/NifX family molybdenum-iron cluster-binding protein [Infirmifilum lucidum]QOJ78940.1 NifB/NifX family molybdenum-iron cluster-binding protein [Infirmifilum lucidum]
MQALIPVVKVSDKLFLSPHFGRAPEFAVYEVEGGRIVDTHFVENPYAKSEEHSGHGRVVLELVSSLNPDVAVVRSIGGGAFYRLKSRGVRVYRSTDREAIEAVLKLVGGTGGVAGALRGTLDYNLEVSPFSVEACLIESL